MKTRGSIAAGPLHKEKSILYATIDREKSRAQRNSLDPAGHYGRSDTFELIVDRRPRNPVTFRDKDEHPG